MAISNLAKKQYIHINLSTEKKYLSIYMNF
jgi:hypothetical protein